MPTEEFNPYQSPRTPPEMRPRERPMPNFAAVLMFVVAAIPAGMLAFGVAMGIVLAIGGEALGGLAVLCGFAAMGLTTVGLAHFTITKLM